MAIRLDDDISAILEEQESILAEFFGEETASELMANPTKDMGVSEKELEDELDNATTNDTEEDN